MIRTLKGFSTLGISPLIFFAIFIACVAPPFLLILIPAYALGAFALYWRPKEKPQTFDEWWDDNWKDFL